MTNSFFRINSLRGNKCAFIDTSVFSQVIIRSLKFSGILTRIKMSWICYCFVCTEFRESYLIKRFSVLSNVLPILIKQFTVVLNVPSIVFHNIGTCLLQKNLGHFVTQTFLVLKLSLHTFWYYNSMSQRLFLD